MTEWHFRGDTLKCRSWYYQYLGGGLIAKAQQRQHSEHRNVLGWAWREYSQRGCTKERLAEERRHSKSPYYPSQWYRNLCKYCSKGFWGKWEKVTPLQESIFSLISVPHYTEYNKKNCWINASRMNVLTNAGISQLYDSMYRYSQL